MKNKKLKFFGIILCLAISLFMLAGCDMGGGGEKGDATLYKLTLSYSSNVNASADDFEVKLAFGERHDLTSRPADDVEELLNSGATQADIDKAGVKQGDGSYYFFDQDPIIITAPEMEGYIFVGFYNKKTNDLYRPILSRTLLDDGTEEYLMSRWNMPGRDTELEARYQDLEYSISYCYGFDKSYDALGNPLPSGLMQSSAHSNPLNYVYKEQADVTLTAPVETFPGYEFDYWFYYEQGTGKEIKVETLPKVYNEEVLHGAVSASIITDCELTLFASYKELSATPTISFKNGSEILSNLDNCIELTIKDQYGETLEKAESYPCGSTIEFRVNVADLEDAAYIFEGIYVDGAKIPDIEPGRPSNVLDRYILVNDVNIEIKVSIKPCEIFLTISNEGADEVLIFGEETKVDDVLAYPDGIQYLPSSTVYVNANSTITLKVKLTSGYEVIEHSIDYVEVDGNEEDGYMVYSFRISHDYEEIILTFEKPE